MKQTYQKFNLAVIFSVLLTQFFGMPASTEAKELVRPTTVNSHPAMQVVSSKSETKVIVTESFKLECVDSQNINFLLHGIVSADINLTNCLREAKQIAVASAELANDSNIIVSTKNEQAVVKVFASTNKYKITKSYSVAPTAEDINNFVLPVSYKETNIIQVQKISWESNLKTSQLQEVNISSQHNLVLLC